MDHIPFGGIGRWLRHWLADEWAPILFVVGLVAALHHGPLAPVSHPSMLVLGHVRAFATTGEVAKENAPTWLVHIDEADFLARYGERRPLDRCQLRSDLSLILDQRPAVLLIDLDLSPLAKPSEQEKECQVALDQLLKDRARADAIHIWLIRPFPVGVDDLVKEKSQWMQTFDEVGFASAEIDVALGAGTAVSYVCKRGGLAEVALMSMGRSDPCAQGGRHAAPLDFGLYRSRVHAVSTSGFADHPASLKGKTVFFGLRTGRSDRIVTALGESHGVDVHAARYVTLAEGSATPGWFNLALELAFAAAFSLVICTLMPTYVREARALSPFRSQRLTTLLCFFAIVYLSTVLFVFCLAWWLATRGVITEPLLIAIGLAFDGAVVASWRHLGAAEPADGRHETHPSLAAALPWATRLAIIWKGSRGLAMVEASRWLVFCGVVGFGLASTLGVLP